MENRKKLNLGSRVNQLPDAILHHVLSFLDMKQVVETSLVSTRWRYLWIHVPILNFDYSLWKHPSPQKFNKFLQHVFLLRDGSSSANKLSILCYSVNMDVLNMWLTMLSRKHIPQVSLKITSRCSPKEELVPLFFTSSVEVVDIESTFMGGLGVSKHNVQLPNSICYAPHLKTLKLNSIKLPKGDYKKEVTLKCHALENLVLEDCYYAHLASFNILIPQLKVLMVKNTKGGMVTTVGKCIIRISTLNLTTLWLKYCSLDNYFIENCEFLVSAKVEFACGTLLRGKGKSSLDCLRNASMLELSNWTLKTCLEFQGMLAQMPDILCNLRSLKLVKWHQSACTRALASLLTRSPNLEFLVVELIEEKSNISTVGGLGNLSSFGDQMPDAFCSLRYLKLTKWHETALASLLTRFPNIEYLVLELIQEKSNTNTAGDLGKLHLFGDHLKSVEILNFTKCRVEMELVESVLRNAVSLEELTVRLHSSSKEDLKDCMRTIYALPRASSQLYTFVFPP